MGTLGALELLYIWERAQSQSPVHRALALLALAMGESIDDLAQLSIGVRDVRLLALRESVFGNLVSATAHCPRCHETLEFDFTTDDIRVDTSVIGEPLHLEIEDYQIAFRLPNSTDLNIITAATDILDVQQVLLERCVTAITLHGETLALRDIPASTMAQVSEQMAKADPQAEVKLSLTCPTCGHIWLTPFDIAAFFWAELSAWAQRTLMEVHVLAGRYGWREADILNMSAFRRRLYLQMAGDL